MKCIITLVVLCLALHQIRAVTKCYSCSGKCETEAEVTCTTPDKAQCYTTTKDADTTKGCTPGDGTDAEFCTIKQAADDKLGCTQCNEDLCNSAGIHHISALLVSLTAFALLKVIY